MALVVAVLCCDFRIGGLSWFKDCFDFCCCLYERVDTGSGRLMWVGGCKVGGSGPSGCCW